MKNMTIARKRLKSLILNPDQSDDRYTPAAMEKLIASMAEHGILIPFLVIRMAGNKTWMVIDGNRRLKGAIALGWKPSTPIPCIIVDMDENEALVTGLVVNQTRERLSSLLEFEVVCQLSDNGMTQEELALKLGKSQAWCSNRLAIRNLPARIQKKVAAGKIAISHAVVMAPYHKQPKILAMMEEQSESGNSSVSDLRNTSAVAEVKGVPAARMLKPRPVTITKKSRGRIEPRKNGTRIELNLSADDDPKVLAKRVAEIVYKVHRKFHPKD